MMQFNLLPYRAQQQNRRKYRFYGLLLLAALAGGALTGIHLCVIDRQQQHQQARNTWLQHARAALNAEAKRALALQKETNVLRASTKKIEHLQYRRGRTMHFLAALTTAVPHDAHLQKMTQQQHRITLDGYAASNRVVTELLQNLNTQTDDIASAQLLETRATNNDGATRNTEPLAFSVALTLRENL